MSPKLFIAHIVLAVAGLPLVVRAEDTDADKNIFGTVDNPTYPVEKVLKNLVGYALGLVLIIAVFYIIYSGFQIVTAGGDAEKVEKGKKGVMYAVIGIIIALLAQIIVNFAFTAATGTVNPVDVNKLD